jgi:hypothetical protein
LNGRQQPVAQLRIARHVLLRIGPFDRQVSGREHHVGAYAAAVDRIVQQSRDLARRRLNRRDQRVVAAVPAIQRAGQRRLDIGRQFKEMGVNDLPFRIGDFRMDRADIGKRQRQPGPLRHRPAVQPDLGAAA